MAEHLLPPNATMLERAALRSALTALDAVPVPHRSLWNPATCPEHLLPWLAWAVGVEGWSNDWPIVVRRQRVASAFDIQRTKGTLYSVRRVVESFAGQIEIREWWETTPKGVPHTFELVLTLSGTGGEDASAEFTDAVLAEVNRAKPLRSHFTFIQGISVGGVARIAAVGRPVAYARLDTEVQ